MDGLLLYFLDKSYWLPLHLPLYHFSKSNQLTFFRNLGLSVQAFLSIAWLSDIVIFLALVAIVNSIT
tara:strand:- start:51628 stop:51828 length:201 start_codon:yes stop_codon:yes gene_type:complete